MNQPLILELTAEEVTYLIECLVDDFEMAEVADDQEQVWVQAALKHNPTIQQKIADAHKGRTEENAGC